MTAVKTNVNTTSTIVSPPTPAADFSVSTNPVDQSLPEENLNNKNELTLKEEISPRKSFKDVKASFTIDMSAPKGDSFGDIMGEGGNGAPVQPPLGDRPPAQTKEEVLAEFAREAGLTRKPE